MSVFYLIFYIKSKNSYFLKFSGSLSLSPSIPPDCPQSSTPFCCLLSPLLLKFILIDNLYFSNFAAVCAYFDAFFSNPLISFSEPGYYEDGNFGIRLENVLLVKEADTKFNFGDKGYLSFEHITWVSLFVVSSTIFSFFCSFPNAV